MRFSAELILLMGVWMSVFPANRAQAAEPFVVVELFSSEGCSSCPPADELLTQITQEAAKNNQRVVTLSFQVDYWNYLGWRDPLSQSAFSDRQRRYAQVLGLDSVYTPQMIINGQEAFVGSDRRKALQFISKYLKIPAQTTIDLDIKEINDNEIVVAFKVDPMIEDAVMNLALVQSKAVSEVTAGENQGRTLRHVNVVRAFKSVELDDFAGQVTFGQSFMLAKGEGLIIGYVQKRSSMEILAIAQSKIVE